MITHIPVGNAQATTEPELLASLRAYKHPHLVERLQKELSISSEQAEQLFEDTKLFLYICGTCHGNWSPSRMIDEGWHNFILFTRDYTAFCDKFFGRFIHHQPNTAGEAPDRERPRRTLIAAIQMFGRENLSPNWVYCNAAGVPVLGPSATDVVSLDLLGPCDSCGCGAACNDD